MLTGVPDLSVAQLSLLCLLYTSIILSSDNGPVLDDGYDDKAVELAGSHKPGGHLLWGIVTFTREANDWIQSIWLSNVFKVWFFFTCAG